jgi:replicative DNA helicase
MITENLELEQAVIGTIVLNNNLYFNITFLESKHFNFDQHQKIFAEIEKRIINNEKADYTTLKPFLLNNKIEDYMLKACLQNATSISLFEYGKEIIKLWQLRETKLLLKSIFKNENFQLINKQKFFCLNIVYNQNERFVRCQRIG